MDKQKAIYYIENSFLTSLLKDKDITDISFNGKDIYFVSNLEGRKKSDIVIEHQLAKDFIRQVANIAEKQFSFTNPILDISVGKYRINATHQSIGRINDEGVITFSIRIAAESARISKDSDFLTRDIFSLIQAILKVKESIVIGGLTSSGKTEFQKFLLSNLKDFERVIVIDNVLELDQIRNDKLDLTCWQVDENNINANPSLLIKNALRNNPDWLILAEARGEEMVDVLNSAMTGMPIITTLHSRDCSSLPHRMGRMMMKSQQKIDYEDALKDIYYHFHFYFYLKKEEINGAIKRYIAEINYIDNQGNVYNLYSKVDKQDNYHHFNDEMIKLLDIHQDDQVVKSKFMEAD